MKFAIISILLSFFCKEIKALINFPHIDIFSYGYNLLSRNPYENISSISMTSSFSLFSLTYKQNKTTPDQMYLIPDNINLYSIRFCPNEPIYYEIFGETSYFNFLSESIKTPDNFSGNFEKGAFSNSPEFKRISLENYVNDNLIVYVLNECSVYLMESQTSSLQLNPNFVDIIKKLMFNNDNDTKAFFYIFDKFGTHYIFKMIFGSKAIKESKISRPSYQSFSFKLFETKKAAINSFLNWTGNSLNEIDKCLAYDWEEVIEDKKIIFGANPEHDLDGKNEIWFNSSKLSPAPLYYELDYIYNLIDKKYFPEIDPQILSNFRAKLMSQIEAYCKDKVGTRFLGPKMDKMFPSYRIMKGKEKVESKDGPNHMTSPPSDFPNYATYSANGVGIQRVPGNSDLNFHFYFFQDFRVACSNDIGSVCYMTYTPYKTTSYRDSVTCPSYDPIGVCVSCPTGYVATSCGYKPNSLLHEANPEVFPLDAKTCKCFHSKGVDCQVMCLNDDSKRIQKSYEIIKANGINEFTVFCPKYKSSFGCGIKSSKTGDAGPWWVYPIPNGCVCYSQNQAICYAICVDFYDYEQIGNCSGCLASKCQKNGCQIDGCEDSYFYDSINKMCMPKPCYENCRSCTSLNKCSFCTSVCSQTENPREKTCNDDYTNQGCLPCKPNKYRNSFGFCTSCDVKNDPEKYRLGGNEGNGVCKLCSEIIENCEFCNTEYLPECWKCKSYFFLDKNNHCTLCKNDTFFSKGLNDGTGKCRSCSEEYDENCIACNDSMCIICKIGYFVSIKDNKCNNCSLLNLCCEKCNSSMCLSCSGNHIFDGNGGCLACEIGYFLSKTNYECYACSNSHPFCDQCNSSMCLRCSGNHILDGNGGCLACEIGYFLSITNFECYPCSNLHLFCDQCNSSVCLHCSGNHILDGNSGCLACEIGYFLSITNFECYPCSNLHPFCDQCNSSMCLHCSGNHIFDGNGGCLACKIGYFLSITNYECFPCSDLHPFCDQCNSSVCFHCSGNHILDGNTGCLACKIGYFLSITNFECYPCSNSHPFCDQCNSSMCLRCSGNHILDGNGGCLACEIGYFLSITNFECYPCSNLHLFCDQCNSSVCLHCSGNHILDGNTGCLACEIGYFLSITNFECYPCSILHPFCDQCNPSMCLHCSGNHIFDGNGGCLACKIGYFLSITNYECYPCYSSYTFCDRCNSKICLRCTENYALDQNGECTICTGKYIEVLKNGTRICRNCSDFLYECSLCDNNMCVICKPGFYLSKDKICVACVNKYDLFNKVGYEKCNYCSSFFENCFSCDENSCHQCLSNTFHKNSKTCSPCLETCSECPSIKNCQKCEYLNFQIRCIKCYENFLMTPEGDCVLCNQLENFYIFENTYCLKLALPKYQTNSLLIPNQKIIEKNLEYWIISQVCSLNDTVTSYKSDLIMVYWSAIQSLMIDFDDSFDNVKNLSVNSNNSKDFKEYQSFGYSIDNRILLNLASNITYKIMYYCEIPFNHVSKDKKGEFLIKRISLSAKIIMEFSMKSVVGIIESEDRIICLLEKVLNQEEKFLISKKNGDFCNAASADEINNTSRSSYQKYFSSFKSIFIFNFKSNPFVFDNEDDFNQVKIQLNSLEFQTNMNKNLSFSKLDKTNFVIQNINEDISIIPINNRNLSVDDLIFFSNSIENNFNNQSYNLTVVFTLKPKEDQKIIIYAFSILNSSENVSRLFPVFNGEELYASKSNITFDFKGKSYLKSNSTVNLSLILLEKNRIIDLYFCVTDLNLKNSSEVFFFPVFRLVNISASISASGDDELSKEKIAGLSVGIILSCFLLISIILIIRRRCKSRERENLGIPDIRNLQMRNQQNNNQQENDHNNRNNRIQIPDEVREAMNGRQ